MNITIIHGQSHKGTSYHVGRELVKNFDSCQVKEFFLPKVIPDFCLSCYQCLKKDLSHCPHAEKCQPITEAMKNADLLIFTTPVYCMRSSAAMKSLFDHHFIWWMNHRPENSMFFKKAIVIAVGAGGGMKKATADIKVNLENWGISAIWSYSIASGVMLWNEVSRGKLDKIKRDMTDLADKIKRKSVRIKTGQKFHFACMRFVQKINWCTPEDKAYWQEKGWHDHVRPWRVNL